MPIGNESWNAMIAIAYNENMVVIVHLSLLMFMYNKNSFVSTRSSKSSL